MYINDKLVRGIKGVFIASRAGRLTTITIEKYVIEDK